METESAQLPITYFPHTFLEGNDLKRLVLYFSGVCLLQVSPNFDPGLPAEVRRLQIVEPFCPFAGSPLLQTIERAHQSYHQLGSVYQDGGLVQLLRAFAIQEDFEKSRTGLVARLRQAHSRFTPEEVELVDDAVFLLLAHEFDRTHLELDLHLERIRGLETRVHEEVGIVAHEEEGTLTPDTPYLAESGAPRAQYSFERLRAWTRLYCRQGTPRSSLPLCTSNEVLEEITERLPAQLRRLFNGPSETAPVRCPLALLPDPQTLSLEEVLGLRQSLSRERLLQNWWQAAAAAIDRLQKETVTEDRCRGLQEQLQESARVFSRHWPAPAGPTRCLRLEALSYPRLQPHLAFTLAAGLQKPAPELQYPAGANGITLHIFPEAPPPGDRW